LNRHPKLIWHNRSDRNFCTTSCQSISDTGCFDLFTAISNRDKNTLRHVEDRRRGIKTRTCSGQRCERLDSCRSESKQGGKKPGHLVFFAMDCKTLINAFDYILRPARQKVLTHIDHPRPETRDAISFLFCSREGAPEPRAGSRDVEHLVPILYILVTYTLPRHNESLRQAYDMNDGGVRVARRGVAPDGDRQNDDETIIR
jgi:hypothetical protein